MNLSRPDRTLRLDALAAEYALGTLPARARRRLDALARTDRVVADALRTWEVRLATLASAVPGITPPPRVWEGISARLGLESARRKTPSQAPWWASVSLWRGLAFAGFAATFALTVTLLAPRTPRADEPIVAVLAAGPEAKPVLVASVERGGRFLTVKVVTPVALEPGRALELWALPDGAAPRSLGLVSASGVARLPLPVPAEVAFRDVPTLAISLEPAGGSPTGAPTGPVLYTGGVQKMY